VTGADPLTAEILKARGITRLVYFHCDHFEPWRYVEGRPADLALAVDDVERYIAASSTGFGARATLFYKANINFLVDGDRKLWRAHPADRLGFVPPSREADGWSAAVLGALSAAGRELQVHIHHENVTWNDGIRDAAVRAYLATPENRRFDDARFELLVRLNLSLLARQANFDRSRWFFVHGQWALNASDPHECTIVREIEILRRNGCLGDFTQPAGRVHVDSRIDEPFLARPVPLAKGYDRPEAEPAAASGCGDVAEDRFFLWASRIDHRSCSIDHRAEFVVRRMADPTVFARAQAEAGFAHDGVLYVKTHAHSMDPFYWRDPAVADFPHVHPGIVRELGGLFDTAESCGIVVELATASEAFDRVTGAVPAADRDLVARYGLDKGDPMALVGCDVVHADADGPVPPPPLRSDPRPIGKMRPARTAMAEDPSVWPEIVAVAEADRARGGVGGWLSRLIGRAA